MSTFGIRTVDPRDTLEIVSTCGKPLPDLLNTLQAVPSVGGGVLLIVLLAKSRRSGCSKIVWSSLRPRGTCRLVAMVATEIAVLT